MASQYTLDDWENTTATVLIGLIPAQSVDSALTLVSSYLSNIGGWIPDSSSDPTGTGNPANGLNPSDAASSIASLEFSKVYDSSVSMTFQVQLQYLQKLSPNLSPAQVLAAIQAGITDWITSQINSSEMPVSVAVNSFVSVGGNVAGNGFVTPTERVAIAQEIAAGGKLIDYKAIALSYATGAYLLDNRWNVSQVYTDVDLPICIQINHYTDTTFASVDPTLLQEYLITLNPADYSVQSGMLVPNNLTGA